MTTTTPNDSTVSVSFAEDDDDWVVKGGSFFLDDDDDDVTIGYDSYVPTLDLCVLVIVVFW